MGSYLFNELQGLSNMKIRMKKGGWNCNGNKVYRIPKWIILQEYTIQGQWQLWEYKTPEEDEQFSAHGAFLE